jgi:hypothetical protein
MDSRRQTVRRCLIAAAVAAGGYIAFRLLRPVLEVAILTWVLKHWW